MRTSIMLVRITSGPSQEALLVQETSDRTPARLLGHTHPRLLWIFYAFSRPAHAEGLRRLRDVAFSTFDLGGRLEDAWVVYEDRERSLWLGTGDRGLLRWRGGEITTVATRDGLPGNWVRAILEDRAGALWIGTTEGLARRDRNGSVRAWRREDGLPDPYVRVVYEDGDGTLWAGTERAGLLRWGAAPNWAWRGCRP